MRTRVSMKKFSLILVCLICVLLFVGITVAHSRFNGGVLAALAVINKRATTPLSSVILTDRGFFPKDITISQGSIVVFSTITRAPFWPASDFHPSHTLYPEFDPKAPVSPSHEWQFTFSKPGVWTYHDHLHPQYQ